MKNLFLFCLTAVCTISTFAQKRKGLELVQTYKIKATDFSVDQMGNLYIVTANDQLKKLNEKGDSMATYNLSKRYGKLSAIDVTNPLKVMLYYKDYATVVMVDRLLNVTNTIDLRKQNIYQVNTLATSYDGQLWFYDEQDAKVKKINDKGKITAQTVDLRQVLEELPTPEKIIDNDNLLYLYDRKMGLYVFDYYGSLKTKTAVLGWSDLYAGKNTVYGLKKDTLQKLVLGNPFITSTPLFPITHPIKMVVAANKIYFLYAGEIKVYRNP